MIQLEQGSIGHVSRTTLEVDDLRRMNLKEQLQSGCYGQDGRVFTHNGVEVGRYNFEALLKVIPEAQDAYAVDEYNLPYGTIVAVLKRWYIKPCLFRPVALLQPGNSLLDSHHLLPISTSLSETKWGYRDSINLLIRHTKAVLRNLENPRQRAPGVLTTDLRTFSGFLQWGIPFRYFKKRFSGLDRESLMSVIGEYRTNSIDYLEPEFREGFAQFVDDLEADLAVIGRRFKWTDIQRPWIEDEVTGGAGGIPAIHTKQPVADKYFLGLDELSFMGDW